MPYIKKKDRVDVIYCCGSAGELNYYITKVILNYLGSGYNYQKINDAVGALEGAKLELYRRLAAPYEDLKIKENGDIEGY